MIHRKVVASQIKSGNNDIPFSMGSLVLMGLAVGVIFSTFFMSLPTAYFTLLVACFLLILSINIEVLRQAMVNLSKEKF